MELQGKRAHQNDGEHGNRNIGEGKSISHTHHTEGNRIEKTGAADENGLK